MARRVPGHALTAGVLLLVTPVAQLFCGYVESYAPLAATGLVFCAAGLDRVTGGGRTALAAALPAPRAWPSPRTRSAWRSCRPRSCWCARQAGRTSASSGGAFCARAWAPCSGWARCSGSFSRSTPGCARAARGCAPWRRRSACPSSSTSSPSCSTRGHGPIPIGFILCSTWPTFSIRPGWPARSGWPGWPRWPRNRRGGARSLHPGALRGTHAAGRVPVPRPPAHAARRGARLGSLFRAGPRAYEPGGRHGGGRRGTAAGRAGALRGALLHPPWIGIQASESRSAARRPGGHHGPAAPRGVCRLRLPGRHGQSPGRRAAAGPGGARLSPVAGGRPGTDRPGVSAWWRWG